MLNLVLGFLWLAAGVALFGYEMATGKSVMRIPMLGISNGWLCLLLAGWNFARWYGRRANQAEQHALQIAHEARLRRGRHHERPSEPDPTFDFSDRPAASPPARNLTDQPPSNN